MRARYVDITRDSAIRYATPTLRRYAAFTRCCAMMRAAIRMRHVCLIHCHYCAAIRYYAMFYTLMLIRYAILRLPLMLPTERGDERCIDARMRDICQQMSEE